MTSEPASPAGPLAAPRGRRLAGRIVDLVVAGWVLAFVAIELDGRILGGDILARRPLSAVTPEGTRLAVIALLVVAALEVVPMALRGRTPGKVLLGMRVVDVDTGGPPGFLRAILRALLVHGWVALPALGWLLPVAVAVTTLVSPSGRGIHDRLAGTLVLDAAPTES